MKREELRDKYQNEICALCRGVFIWGCESRGWTCEGRWCQESEDDYADDNDIELED